MSVDAAIAALERLVADDEIFTLRRIARGSWEAWSYEGDVGRGSTPACAVRQLAELLR